MSAARRQRDAGFTLLETLITLAVIATLASVMVLSLGGTRRDAGPEAEARRLADRLHLAVDEALLDGGRLALQWDNNTYKFSVWDRQKSAWSPSENAFLSERTLGDAIRFGIEGAEERLEIGGDGFGDPLLVSFGNTNGAWRVDFDGFRAAVSPVVR